MEFGTICFASETGTSQRFAEKLFFLLSRQTRPDSVKLVAIEDLDDADWLENEEGFVIFIVSTCGEGEVPTAMKPLWTKLLRANLPGDLLQGAAKIGIFGLGDGSYEKFNAAARKFRARLMQLGMNELCPTSAGDDQSDTELSFDRWVEGKLLVSLREQFPNMMKEFDPKPCLIPLRSTCKITSIDMMKEEEKNGEDVSLKRHENTMELTVISNEEITKDEWLQSEVRHISFENSSTNSSTSEDLSHHLYRAGDVLYVYPENNPDQVDEFIAKKLPDMDPNCIIESSLYPTTTLRTLLIRFIDLNAMPSRFFFEQASFFCDDEEQKEKCYEMASHDAEDAGTYILYCKRERRGFLEVLLEFTSCMIPFHYLLELIPAMKPRGYSISSSPSYHGGNKFHVTLGLVRFQTPTKRWKTGTCSIYLKQIKPKQTISAYVVHGLLEVPKSKESPMVLIGTGTGCAPMRSLLFERFAREGGQNRLPKSSTRYYFGCRTRQGDYLYENEWEKVCESVSIAFSRDDKKRVPILLARDGKEIYDMVIVKKGCLYVSGSAKRMPADIRETLTQIIMNHGPMERAPASKLIRDLEKERRYVVEAWS